MHRMALVIFLVRPLISFEMEILIAEDLDRYKAPVIKVRSEHLLLEIDISHHETQTFLFDQSRRALILENIFWADQQISLVDQALTWIRSSGIFNGVLRKKTILLGVWHFGHLIGDHSHRFIEDAMHKISYAEKNYSIHCSSPNQDIHWLQDLFYGGERLPFYEAADSGISKKSVRVFSLEDCYCYFPTRNKAMSLSAASIHVDRMLNIDARIEMGRNRNVLLTSERSSRIENIVELKQRLSEEGWKIINPLRLDILSVLHIVRDANLLVSENGSIVFNCLLARTRSYYILASPRVKCISGESAEWQGGAIYNSYHDDLFTYLSCSCRSEAHHPYSDRIFVTSELVNTLLKLT